MSGNNTVVFGIYPNESELVEAIEQLKHVGFRSTDLSIMIPENLGSKDLGHEKHTKAPEGAVAGATVGAVIGAVLGWLVSTGTIQIPLQGAGGLATAGTAIAILAGIGGLGLLGAIVGAAIGSAQPEYEAKRYQGRIRSGRILLSVHCDNADWRIRAKKVLQHTGADGVASTMEAKADFGPSEKPQPRAQLKMPFTHKTYLTSANRASATRETQLLDETVEDVRSRERTPIL